MRIERGTADPVPRSIRASPLPMQTLLLTAVALALASVGPLIFPAAQAGYGSLATFARIFLLPAIGALALLLAFVRRRDRAVYDAIITGAIAGAVATIALEVVRLTGYRLGFMPGNLPRLMGVLLLDRFASGPSPASDLAGWAYHVWNGASFGIIYVLLLGTRRVWMGVLFGLLVGLGFLVSPVVISLGVGYFGLQFSAGFPATVLLAHLAFGGALGMLAARLCTGCAGVHVAARDCLARLTIISTAH